MSKKRIIYNDTNAAFLKYERVNVVTVDGDSIYVPSEEELTTLEIDQIYVSKDCREKVFYILQEVQKNSIVKYEWINF